MPLLYIAEAVARLGHEVMVCTSDFHEAKWKAHVERLGGKLLPIDTGGETSESWERKVEASGEIPFVPLNKLWKGPVRKLLASVDPKPDVIVADFGALAAMDLAQDSGISLVMNMPAPLTLVSSAFGIPDPGASCQCGGLFVGFSCFAGIKLAMALNLMGMNTMCRSLLKHLKHSVVLANTFVGVDPPRLLPPNLVVTGPLLPPAPALRERLRSGHPELSAWLSRPGAPAAVLISTGTLATLQEWQVQTLYAAVKQANIRAVWTLREGQQQYLPANAKDDPSFWISSWIPQAELMSDEAIKLVLTHSGWGSTLECIVSGQPVVCLPFFGDQFTNADLLVKSGCGEVIYKRKPRLDWRPSNTYREGDFTASSAAAVLQKVLSEPRYKESALKLQRLALATGGAAEAARAIERAGRCGTGHLLSKDLTRSFGGNIFHSLFTAISASLVGLACCLSKPAGAACGCGIASLGLCFKLRQRER